MKKECIHARHNRFSYSQTEGFSVLEKNTVLCSQRAVGCASPLQIVVMAVQRTFLKVLPSRVGCDSPLLAIMTVWHASDSKKSVPNGHYYLQRAVTHDQITQQSSLVKSGGPQSSNGTFRPDFQANTRAQDFYESQCHHKIQEGGCKEIQVQLSLRQF